MVASGFEEGHQSIIAAMWISSYQKEGHKTWGYQTLYS